MIRTAFRTDLVVEVVDRAIIRLRKVLFVLRVTNQSHPEELRAGKGFGA